MRAFYEILPDTHRLSEDELNENAEAQGRWEMLCKESFSALLEDIKNEIPPFKIVKKIRALRTLVDEQSPEEDPVYLFSPVVFDGIFAYLAEQASEMKLPEKYLKELEKKLLEARTEFRRELQTDSEKIYLRNAKEDIALLLFRHVQDKELIKPKLFIRWLAFYAYVLPTKEYCEILSKIQNFLKEKNIQSNDKNIQKALNKLIEKVPEIQAQEKVFNNKINVVKRVSTDWMSIAKKALWLVMIFGIIRGVSGTKREEETAINTSYDDYFKSIPPELFREIGIQMAFHFSPHSDNSENFSLILPKERCYIWEKECNYQGPFSEEENIFDSIINSKKEKQNLLKNLLVKTFFYQKQKNYAEAILSITEVIETFKEMPAYYLMRSEFYRKKNELVLAKLDLKKVDRFIKKDDKNNLYFLKKFKLGYIYIDEKNYFFAEQEFSKIIEEIKVENNSKNLLSVAYANYALALCLNGKCIEGKNFFRESFILSGNLDLTDQTSLVMDARLEAAFYLYQEKKFLDLLNICEIILEFHPKQIEANFLKAEALKEIKLFSESLEWYEKIIQHEVDPQNEMIHIQRANMLMLTKEHIVLEEVLDCYQLALQVNPDSYRIYKARALFYSYLPKFFEKHYIEDIIKLIQLMPSKNYKRLIVPLLFKNLIEKKGSIPQNLQKEVEQEMVVSPLKDRYSQKLLNDAFQGNAIALHTLAKKLYYSNPNKENFLLMRNLLQQSAERGSQYAMRNLLFLMESFELKKLDKIEDLVKDPVFYFYYSEIQELERENYLKKGLEACTSEPLDLYYAYQIVEALGTLYEKQGEIERAKIYFENAKKINASDLMQEKKIFLSYLERSFFDYFLYFIESKSTEGLVVFVVFLLLVTKLIAKEIVNFLRKILRKNGEKNNRNSSQDVLKKSQSLISSHSPVFEYIQNFLLETFYGEGMLNPADFFSVEERKKLDLQPVVKNEKVMRYFFAALDPMQNSVIKSRKYGSFKISNKKLMEEISELLSCYHIKVEEMLANEDSANRNLYYLTNLPKNFNSISIEIEYFKNDLYQYSEEKLIEIEKDKGRKIKDCLEILLPIVKWECNVDDNHELNFSFQIESSKNFNIFIPNVQVRNKQQDVNFSVPFEIIVKEFLVELSCRNAGVAYEINSSEKNKKYIFKNFNENLKEKFKDKNEFYNNLKTKLYRWYEEQFLAAEREKATQNKSSNTPAVELKILKEKNFSSKSEKYERKAAIAKESLFLGEVVNQENTSSTTAAAIATKETPSFADYVPPEKKKPKRKIRKTVSEKKYQPVSEKQKSFDALKESYLALSGHVNNDGLMKDYLSHKIYQYALIQRLFAFWKALAYYQKTCDEKESVVKQFQENDAYKLENIFMHDIYKYFQSNEYLKTELIKIASFVKNYFDFLAKTNKRSVDLHHADLGAFWSIHNWHTTTPPTFQERIKLIENLLATLEELMKELKSKSNIAFKEAHMAALKFTLAAIGEQTQQIAHIYARENHQLHYQVSAYPGLAFICKILVRHVISHNPQKINVTPRFFKEEEISDETLHDYGIALVAIKPLLAKLSSALTSNINLNPNSDLGRIKLIIVYLEKILEINAGKYRDNLFMQASKNYYLEKISQLINKLNNKDIFSKENNSERETWSYLQTPERNKIDDNKLSEIKKMLDSHVKDLQNPKQNPITFTKG